MMIERTPAQLAFAATRSAATKAFAESMRTHLLAALDDGPLPDRKLAALLNRKGLRTQTNGRWTASSVATLRIRLGMQKRPASTAIETTATDTGAE